MARLEAALVTQHGNGLGVPAAFANAFVKLLTLLVQRQAKYSRCVMGKHHRRPFVYPIAVTRDGSYLHGELLDWPECHPVGPTHAVMLADAISSIAEMATARMHAQERLPLRGSALPVQPKQRFIFVRLPWRLRVRFLVYEAMRSFRELINR